MKMTKNEIADLIEAFIDGRSGDWDWDDFISIKQADPEIDSIRAQCAKIPEIFPPTEKGYYCAPDGFKALKGLVQNLREANA
jgi:hypothetical protein